VEVGAANLARRVPPVDDLFSTRGASETGGVDEALNVNVLGAADVADGGNNGLIDVGGASDVNVVVG
jgi:hypothetical protein